MGVTRMEGSKITSKTSSLKALLLKAWRERWTDLQWGIQIKTILPRGVSGDVYNLADCILQQALVGSAPNHLVLSYLKHSLSSQLVSYAAVLQRISKYDGLHKPHCVICLLELIESIQSGITCRGKPEEGILATAVLSLTHWLLQVYQHSAAATMSSDGVSSIDVSSGSNLTDPTIASTAAILAKPPIILNALLSSPFLAAMLTLASHEDPDLYEEVIKKCQEILHFHEQEPSLTTPVPVEDSLHKLCTLGRRDECSSEPEPLTYIVQPILAVLVTVDPSIDTARLTDRLKLVAKLKGYGRSRTMCEVMRASLMSLYNALGTSEEIKWGAFTFLKLAHVIACLTPSPSAAYNGEETELIGEAIDELLEYGPLVDLVDSAQSSSSLEALLCELVKARLVTEEKVAAERIRPSSLSSTSSVGGSSGTDHTSGQHLVSSSTTSTQSSAPLTMVIIRAQGTLQRVLKTLDADFTKMQEAIFGVLCQALSGKSFELILAVASVEVKLQLFVSKLIRFNEFSKAGSPSKASLASFDITFLMLAYIVQVYGSRVVLSPRSGDDEETFFESWARACLVERGLPKCPDSMVAAGDPAAVDTLLNLLNSPTPPDYQSCDLSWDVICMAVPAVIKEVLVAWEQGALTANEVKHIIDNLKHNMCCLPICAAAWLCTYMQILHQDALAKPMSMVQQLVSGSGGGVSSSASVGSNSGGGTGGNDGNNSGVAATGSEGTSPSGGGTATTPSTPPAQLPDNYRERSLLMAQVIKKIQYDMHLAAYSKPKPHSHSIISKEPLSDELVKVWESTLERGWLSIQSCRQLESLFYTAGPEWLVTNLVSEVVKVRYKSNLDKAVDLAVAIFHLDIGTCTQVLLNKILPDYLHVPALSKDLVDPVSECLARMCVYCLYSALDQEAPPSSRKRSASLQDDGSVSKLCRLDEEGSGGGSAVGRGVGVSSGSVSVTGGSSVSGSGSGVGVTSGTVTGGGASSVSSLLGVTCIGLSGGTSSPTQSDTAASIARLLKQFNSIIEASVALTQPTYFIFTFLKILTLDNRTTPDILRFIPPTLVRGLVRLVPDLFTEELVLSLYDTTSPIGRKNAASDLCLLRNIYLKPPL